MKMRKLNLLPDALRNILTQAMPDSVNGSVESIVEDVTNEQASLFEIDGGYTLLSITQINNIKLLNIQCVEGFGMLKDDAFLLIEKLCVQEGCKGMICQTEKPGMVRLLKKFGFVPLEEHGNLITLVRGLKWVSQVQHKIAQPESPILPIRRYIPAI